MFVIWLSLLALALAEGLNSLCRGVRQLRGWIPAPGVPSREASSALSPVNVVVPCRGLDPGFEENIEALFALASRDYRLFFVTDSKSDPAYSKLPGLCAGHPDISSRILVAGPARESGQKVHNLLFAVKRLPPDQRALVFADSDIRPLPDWLSALLCELRRGGTGLASGFRWHLPDDKASFGSRLRAAWNGGVLSLLSLEKSPFGWGGALACSSQVFEECGVVEAWKGSLSDDYSISAAIRDGGYKIRFVPRALSPSYGSCSLRQLLAWSARQISITRIYHPGLWKLAWPIQLLYGTSVWVTPVLVLLPESVSRLSLNQRLVLGAMGLMVAGLSSLKAHLRLKTVAGILPEKSKEILREAWFHRLAPPLCNLVTVQALCRSLISKKIEWRGIRYEMHSPTQTRVLSRSDPEPD